MRWVMLLAVLLFLPSIASALSIDTWHSVADLSEKAVHERIELRFEANGTEQAVFGLPPRLSEIRTLIDDKPVQCAQKEKVGTSELRCELPAGKHYMALEYSTPYPLVKLEDRLLFKTTLGLPVLPAEFFYEAKLPLGYVIPSDQDQSLFVSPKPRFTYSDGRRIILVWKKLPREGSFEASVLTTPAAAKASLVWPIGIASAVLGVLALAAYLFFVRRRPEEVIVPELIDAEQLVVSVLRKAKKHQLWQKQILLATKLSKAKLSRTLRNLEQRGVITKEPFGNTNKITLAAKKGEPAQEQRE